MLKRILSAFLLCLCVSPVWGAVPIGPANAGGGGYKGPQVSRSSCSGDDALKIDSSCYWCGVVVETSDSLDYGQFVTHVNLSGVSQYKCVDVNWSSVDKWEKQSDVFCKDSVAKDLKIKNSKMSVVNTKNNKVEKTYLYNSDGKYVDADGKKSYAKVFKGDKYCVKVECLSNKYVFKNGKCELIQSDVSDSKDVVSKKKIKDSDKPRTGNCDKKDLPQFATAGVYNADGKCVATQCKDKTYLVVNASGVSQGWCVADTYCQSVKKMDANKVLNIIDDVKTDLQCIDKTVDVVSDDVGGGVSDENSNAEEEIVHGEPVVITGNYDCEQDVLAKLNAVSGKKMFWDSIEDGYVKAYCDIVCPNEHTRQEQETIIEYQENGETFKSKQKYICVANGDVTTDNTATPMPGGNSASQNVPAKPDGTPCTPTDKNAKRGEYQNGECVIIECNGQYYNVSDDKKSCVEDKEAKSRAKIEELEKNAQAMKDKEQSTENKMLGAASMAATGIGAMQAASAYSEQAADEEAEQAMRAYLATFHCNYGGGINVKGGEKDVQLPGGNELVGLYSEYVNLANNLKVRKAALDMRPGIESEPILDSATSGLYDDVAIGKTSGAFTSLARALMDPNGPDAIAWAKQKADSESQFKSGLTMAGIGAIGGAAGNMLLNNDAAKEDSGDILDKYKDVAKADDSKNDGKQTLKDVVPVDTGDGVAQANAGDVVADAQQAVVTVPAITDLNTEEQVVVDVPVKTDGADNIVMANDGVHIKRIENIINAQSALDALSQQFDKTPSDNVKQAWNKFAEQCQGYQGVLSLELDVLRGNEYDMYEVLCYFPDLDQTVDTVRAAYAVNSEYFTTGNISRSIQIGQSPKFQETDYMKKYETFKQRRGDMGATYNIANINCQIPGVDLQNKCSHYSTMIRIHDKDGKMYLEMLKWDEKNDKSSTLMVE